MSQTNLFLPIVPNILIVDDVPANLKVLGVMLKSNGYKVRPVPNGSLALQVVEKEKPDLILLDIMMPEMDGYEVCKRLKANPKFSDIPVIFISALNDTADIVKAFTSGGVDYITKPFRAEEVLARVETHLRLCYQNRELNRLNSDKDRFISILAHDLKNPFNAILGLSELLAKNIRIYDMAKIENFIYNINKSSKSTYQLLEDLLLWSKAQSKSFPYFPQSIKFKLICTDIVENLQLLANTKNITISIEADEDLNIFIDVNMFKTIVRNLISNAIKFTRKDGFIRISAESIPDNIKVSVADSGVGIAPDVIGKLFDITQTHTTIGTENEKGTGLGLLLCKDFVEKHKGEIWVESEVGKGSRFMFTLPEKME